MAKNAWLYPPPKQWTPKITAVSDGWLIELINERNYAASFFVQWIYFNVPKNTPKHLLNPLLILLSENTANPGESILFKLSATEEEMNTLKKHQFRIAYGTGMGERWWEIILTLP